MQLSSALQVLLDEHHKIKLITARLHNRGLNYPGRTLKQMHEKPEILALTADIVAAFVAKNSVSPADLRTVINDVYRALSDNAGAQPCSAKPDLKPAVPVKRSVHNDYIVCLEDGRRFKSLKRHIRTHYNLTPEQYREKWGLPADYPMVAPKYAATRSLLAKKIGLGRRRK
jgi:predicted transcriptional regulator